MMDEVKLSATMLSVSALSGYCNSHYHTQSQNTMSYYSLCDSCRVIFLNDFKQDVVKSSVNVLKVLAPIELLTAFESVDIALHCQRKVFD